MPEITTLFVLNMWHRLGCTKVSHGVRDWMKDECSAVSSVVPAGCDFWCHSFIRDGGSRG